MIRNHLRQLIAPPINFCELQHKLTISRLLPILFFTAIFSFSLLAFIAIEHIDAVTIGVAPLGSFGDHFDIQGGEDLVDDVSDFFDTFEFAVLEGAEFFGDYRISVKHLFFKLLFDYSKAKSTS